MSQNISEDLEETSVSELRNSELNTIREAYRQALFQRYVATYRAFRNWPGVLNSAALFFCVLVVLPYAFIQFEEQALPERMAVLQESIAVHDRQINAYQSALTGIDNLLADIEQGPMSLRSFLKELWPQAEIRLNEERTSPRNSTETGSFPQGSANAPIGRNQSVKQLPPFPNQVPIPQHIQMTEELLSMERAQNPCQPIADYQQWLRCEVRMEVGRMFDGLERTLMITSKNPWQVLKHHRAP